MSANNSLQEDMTANNEEQTDSNADKVGMVYEPKPTPKVIRVLTVIAYVLSVSLAAIMLSLYYILMWNPPDLYANPTGKHGIQSQRLQQSPHFDDLPMSLSTVEVPDTTVLTSTTEASSEELYELASAETKHGLFLSHLFPKYNSDTNNVSNETLYK